MAAPLTYDGVSSTISGLPTRGDLVRRDRARAAYIDAQIRARAPIEFMPNDVYEMNEYVRNTPVYKLHLFGSLSDGSKAHVIIDNAAVYFDVRISSTFAAAGFESTIRQILVENECCTIRTHGVEAFPARDFHRQKASWMRLYFHNVQQRKRALDAIREHRLETASDDYKHYYRMVARVYNIVLTDWGNLTDYAYHLGGAHPNFSGERSTSPLCEHVFRIDVGSLRPMVDPLDTKEAQEAQYQCIRQNPYLIRDRTLVMGWDIETYSGRCVGDVPLATHAEDRVFMICATVHWKDDPEPLHRVCIVDTPAEPDPRWTTVVCRTEIAVVMAFAAVFRHFAPDIITGFNDGSYDWPFIIETARQHERLGDLVDLMSARPSKGSSDGQLATENAMRWSVRKNQQIKLGACELTNSTYVKVPGCVPVDARIMFRQLYPKAEIGGQSSLNFYLKACNLESKVDMSYIKMWNYYVSRDAAGLREVAHYCVIDAKRCQELLVRRNVLGNCREVAALAYVSLYDAVYYAGGHKVCNMLMAHAFRRDILYSSFAPTPFPGEPSGKYPGAWVFDPVKGLYPDPTDAGAVAIDAARAQCAASADASPEAAARAAADAERVLDSARYKYPISSLDFSSLYPSIIMAFNLSPEKFVRTQGEASRLESEGYQLHKIEFELGGQPVCGWFVRHKNDPASYGLYPAILIDLFERRAGMKKKLAVVEGLKEHIEHVFARVDDGRALIDVVSDELNVRRDTSATAVQIGEYLCAVRDADNPDAEIQRIYTDAQFDYAKIDSKQKALKVFMNTFYGEAGNSTSSLFLLQLAGGVTSIGQANIKMVASLVKRRGFVLIYGDTDSIYISCPASTFREITRRYVIDAISREAYWGEMVKITMKELDALRTYINDTLHETTGTRFLKMAYEEVLYPVVFTGKKKYFGIAHVSIANFRPKKLFIRGIDVVKLGQTKLAKDIGHRIMWAAVAVDNTRDLLTIVTDVLREAITNREQWAFEDFIQSAAWKPDKQNITVQRFIKRMRAQRDILRAENDRRVAAGESAVTNAYYVPEPGERFQFVLVEGGDPFNKRGIRQHADKSSIMEYADVARERNMPIDISNYLERYIVGLCARFINHAGQFQSPDGTTPDDISQRAAKAYLTQFIQKLQNTNAMPIQALGRIYRRAWNRTEAACKRRLYAQIGIAADVLHGDSLEWEDFLAPVGANESVVSELVVRARDAADAHANTTPSALRDACRHFGIDRDGSDLDDNKACRNLYRTADAFDPPTHKRRSGVTVRTAVLSALDRREAELRRRLGALVEGVADIAMRYDVRVAEMITLARAREVSGANEPDDAAHIQISDTDRSALWEFRQLWYQFVGIYCARLRHRAVVEFLNQTKRSRQGYIRPPAANVIDQTIDTAHVADLNIPTIGNGEY